MKEKIPRRSSRCHLGGEPLTPGTEYFSILIPTEMGYERKDYCPTCFEKINKQEGAQYWKGKIPQKIEKRQTPDQKALDLFRKMEDPKLLVVLALYLQRRDQVIKRGELYYEIPETGEVIAVPKISLTPDEGKALGEQLIDLLNAP